MNCPPDVLCKWLGDRWETMEELAVALEIEAGKTRRGKAKHEQAEKPGEMGRDIQAARDWDAPEDHIQDGRHGGI